MIQTLKKYKEINGSFIEDPDGFVIGYAWTDSNSIQRRCLYISSVDDLINRTTSAVCRYEFYDPETTEWILRKTVNSYATMDSYVYANGTPELIPYEDDLDSPIYDAVDHVTVIGYNQKLKSGLIPEFQFFYNLQLQLFSGIIMHIQAVKFGATGFN